MDKKRIPKTIPFDVAVYAEAKSLAALEDMYLNEYIERAVAAENRRVREARDAAKR